MDFHLFVTIFLWVITSSFFYVVWVMKKRKLLGSPFSVPFPVVGDLPYLGKMWNITNYSKNFPFLWGLQLGTTSAVVITNLETLHELFVEHSESTRYRRMTSTLSSVYKSPNSSEGRGLVLARMSFAERHRRAIKLLSDGKRLNSIIDMIELPIYRDDNTWRIDFKYLSMDVITRYLTGKPLSHVDFETISPKFDRFNEMLLTSVQDVIPWVKYIPYLKSTRHVEEAAREIIAHLNTLCYESERGTLGWEIYNQTDVSKKIEDIFLLFDLFFAGAETTYIAFNWILMYMMEYPEIQDRLRSVLLSDVSQEDKTAHMRLVINEVLLFRPPAPFGIAHLVENDIFVENGGVTIPKDTVIIQDLYTISQKIIDGRRFDPFAVKTDTTENVAFGLGPRQCIGRKIAMTELERICIRMFTKYKFVSDRQINLTPLPSSMLSLQFEPYSITNLITI